jgi:hypothetical protein
MLNHLQEGLQNGGHTPEDFDDLDSKLYDLEDIKNQHSSSYFHIGKQIRIRFILSEAATIGVTENMSIRKLLNPLKVTLMQSEEPDVVCLFFFPFVCCYCICFLILHLVALMCSGSGSLVLRMGP